MKTQCGILALVALAASPAGATFPGTNGEVAYLEDRFALDPDWQPVVPRLTVQVDDGHQTRCAASGSSCARSRARS